MKKTILVFAAVLFVVAVCLSITSHAGEVTSINVKGKTIKIGDTADHVVSILNKSELINQTVSKDPNNPNSLLVIKQFKVKKKNFTIHLARVEDPGPYKVVKIITK